MRIQSLLRAVAGVGIMLYVALAAKGQQPNIQVLSNADIVSMTQAELGDSVIIDKIKSSHCRFDTSPRSLTF